MQTLCLGACLLLTLAGNPASATLIPVDLAGGPANEATLDDLTGLTWYDVSETVGVSYANALAVAFAATGTVWRHATGAEVCALFTAYADPAFSCSGAPPAGTSQVAGDVSSGFRDLLGPTADGATYIFGYYDDGDGNPEVGTASTNAFFLAGNQFTLTTVAANGAAIDEVQAVTGNWLVAVPEPGSGALAALGLSAIAARSRKRRTRTSR